MAMRFALAGWLAVLATLAGLDLASAEAACGGGGDLGDTHWACVKSGTETLAYIAGHSGHTFVVALACATDNSLCSDTPTCQDGDQMGQVYDVWEDGDRLDWQACLTEQEAQSLRSVTPGMVLHAFRRLHWPASQLVVQPPDGRTLVNFDTNFYTANDHPTTQTVTLLGQAVTIEATPTTYTWHFGDDDTLAAHDPGAAYPDLQITHRYTHVGSLSPSVDTTYSGRFRVGDGTWQQIPDTLTVPGSPVDLRVLSATPHLVGY